MKLLSSKLESKAIRTICESKQKVAGYVLANVGEDYFYNDTTSQAFKRVLKLARKTGQVPDYSELCTDPALSEDVRKLLLRNKEKPAKNREQATKLVRGLDKYRKLRGLYFSFESGLQKFSEESVDPEEMIDELTDKITRLRTSLERKNSIFNIGYKNNTTKLVKAILDDGPPEVIPTGFEDWDKVNGGLFPRSLVIPAASTGGGKSTLSNQLLLHMSKMGYDTCLVPLEMSEKETMYRILANLSGIDVTKIMQKKLSKGERKKLMKSYRKYIRQCKELKAKYSIFAPEEDMSIDEILFLLKPYKYQVIVIDYISLLKGAGDGDNDVRALGQIARQAKIFARATGTLVILCAQLSDDGRVKYSRAIQEHADVVWVWNYTDENRETQILDLRTLKARNQVPINFQLWHDYSVMRVGNLKNGQSEEMRTTKGDKRRKALDEFVEEVTLDEDDD